MTQGEGELGHTRTFPSLFIWGPNTNFPAIFTPHCHSTLLCGMTATQHKTNTNKANKHTLYQQWGQWQNRGTTHCVKFMPNPQHTVWHGGEAPLSRLKETHLSSAHTTGLMLLPMVFFLHLPRETEFREGGYHDPHLFVPPYLTSQSSTVTKTKVEARPYGEATLEVFSRRPGLFVC